MNHDSYPDYFIRDILTETKTIALVGGMLVMHLRGHGGHGSGGCGGGHGHSQGEGQGHGHL